VSYFRLTPDAQSDLIEIRRYTLKQWGEPQSKKYLSELRQTVRMLAESPSLGKSRPELGSNVLSFPYASHVIYYLQHEKQIVVFGALHKRMVPVKYLHERETI
jgi:toxin ParE1/3/4